MWSRRGAVAAVIVPDLLIPVPAVIVLELAVAARPIPLIELLRFVGRIHPNRALEGSPAVVATVPDTAAIGGAPVASHPGVAGSGGLEQTRMTRGAGGAPILIPIENCSNGAQSADNLTVSSFLRASGYLSAHREQVQGRTV